ncbi:MAG: ABC transporter substrate-binding protein [Parvibaculaceae bacterium]
MRAEAARLISRSARSIGLDVEQNLMDYNAGFQKVATDHDFDLTIIRFSGTAERLDPNVFLSKLYASSEYKPGSFNWTGLKDEKLDAFILKQQSEMDVEKRREIVFAAQKAAFDVHSRSVLVYPANTQAYRSDRVRNLVPGAGEGIGALWTDLSAEPIGGDGFIRTGATVELKSLNPVAVADNNEIFELRMIYDRLLQVGADGSIKMWAARDVKLRDPVTIDIQLRENMTFHDGKPVTAEDVKFSIDYHKRWNAPYYLEALSKVAGVTVTASHTLTLRLTEAYAPLYFNLLASIFIIPKHIWQTFPESVGVDDPLKWDNPTPVGSGPFKFDYWRRGAELRVSANTGHFNPPKNAGILRIVYGSHDALAAAIERNECDRTRYVIKPSLMDALSKVENCVGKAYPSHGVYDFSYNCVNTPFSDPALRRAFEHILPKEVIRSVLLSGYADIGGSIIAPSNEFWHNDDVKPLAEDVQAARGILSEAGYSWDGGGSLLMPR